jgi:hypothetical protein
MLLFTGFLAVALAVAVPALAEFSSDKQTDWGVQTKGNSDTISEWAALAWEVDQVDGTIFIGGNYLEVTNGSQIHSQPYLSAFDAETGAWQSWFRPEVGSAVFALQPTPDGGLLVGGEIGTWNGDLIGSLVKIDPATGDRWPGFPTRLFGGNTVVRDLKLESDGYVYAVGSFTQANDGDGPFGVSGAVRFDPITGDIDQTWTPTLTSGAAWGVSRSKTQNVTYIAGFFQEVNSDNETRGFVGVDDTGTVVTDRSIVPFNGCTTFAYCSQLYDVEATEAGHIWVAGVEHALYILDETDGSLVKQHYTGCDPSRNDCFVNWVGGEFQEIERVGERIYASCHCWHDIFSDDQIIYHREGSGEHHTIKGLGAFDAATGEIIPEFQPELRGDSGGFGMHQNPSDGCLWVVGGFSSYGSPGGPQPPSYDVVRICDELGPGPAAGPAAAPPTPTACVVTHEPGQTEATLFWTAEPSATGTILYRRVNEGSTFWMGRVDPPAASTFVTSPVSVSLTHYFVQHAYPAGQRSDLLPCGSVDLRPDLTPATECSVAVGPNNEAILNWQAGNDNADFVVRRSVDGGPNYWRARVTDTGYTDNLIVLDKSYTFTVEARDASGEVAPATPCSPSILIKSPSPDSVGWCVATILPDNTISIEWPDGSSTARYIVRRSVNNSPSYWRARVDSLGGGGTLSYVDPLVTLGSSYVFTVEAVGTDNSATPATPCSPSPVVVEAPPVIPASSCAVVDSGGSYTIAWTYGEGAPASDAIVERARNDVGTFGWRARTSETTFIDSRLQPGVDYSYRVRMVSDDERRSEPTVCELG